jgi:hypothetical protein
MHLSSLRRSLMTDTDKRIKGAKRMAVRQRNYRRARDRAMTRLATAYPETYKELLEQEKIVDEQMGKKWLDIDGSTGQSMDLGASASPTGGGEGNQASTGPDEGNDGGEA